MQWEQTQPMQWGTTQPMQWEQTQPMPWKHTQIMQWQHSMQWEPHTSSSGSIALSSQCTDLRS